MHSIRSSNATQRCCCFIATTQTKDRHGRLSSVLSSTIDRQISTGRGHPSNNERFNNSLLRLDYYRQHYRQVLFRALSSTGGISNTSNSLEVTNNNSNYNNNSKELSLQNTPMSAYTPQNVREQIALALNQYLIEKSPELKQIKKKERFLKKWEWEQSVEGQQLVESFDQYVIYENAEDANNWALHLIEQLEKQYKIDQEPVHVGLHVGWNMYGKKREKRVTQLLTLSFPNQPVAVLQLYRLECFNDATKFPEHVRTLLQLPYIKACGININRYVARIKRYLHVIIPVRIEIDKCALLLEPSAIKDAMQQEFIGYLDIFEDPTKAKKKLPGMKLLCSKYLNVDIDATIGKPHLIDYFQDPLPEKVYKFVTVESYHYRCICETLITMIKNDVTMLQPSVQFAVGTKVKIYIGSKVNHCAEGIIEYLGGVNGETVGFGEKLVNEGMVLVRLIEVYDGEVKPKYAKETYMVYGFSWERDLTLGAVFVSKLPLIAIDTKRLVRLDDVEKNLFADQQIIKLKKKKPKPKLTPKQKKEIKKRRNRKLRKELEEMDSKARIENDYKF